ncbi:uncharacterized protein LOC144439730 isoform X2 [Glandiceps talaboti]
MIVRNLRVATAAILITWSAVFHNCQSQTTTTVGPTNTVYVSKDAYASFNCSVNWKADDDLYDSIFWEISEDDGDTWNRVAQCYYSGTCVITRDLESAYSVDSNSPNDFFKLNIGPASLAEDGLYECYSFDEKAASAPHARLVVLEQSSVPDIEDYSSNEEVIVRETSPFEFTCTATGGNPAAELIWEIIDRNDRTDITDITSSSTSTTTENSGNNKLYDTTSILNHTFNSSDDGKNLKCSSFQHESFTPISDQIVLNVEHSPVIHTIAIVEWHDNSLVDVECVATANPDSITYSWVSYGEIDGGQTGSGRIWQVEDIDQNNKIDVSCTADNGIGSPNTLRLELNKPFDPTTRSATPSPVSGKPAPQTGGGGGCDTGCIIGVSIAGAVLLAFIIGLLVWVFLFREKGEKGEKYGPGTGNHKQPPHSAPADVEMTSPHLTTIPSGNDDTDNRYNNYSDYNDRYDDRDRYENTPTHRYDDPPDEYSRSPRYDEPPIDEGDGYPNYSNPNSPNYSSYDRRQHPPAGTPGLNYTDLDLGPPSQQDYQPQPHTEYATITPTIV